jgi:hypothetical protein
MNFPANPTLNQTYTYGTRTWKWDGTTWNLQRGATALATVATTGSFTDLVNKPTTIAGYGIVDATAAIPKITSIVVTDSSYTVLDDTAVSTAGGYIKIIGTGFTTASQVLVNTTSASSVSFVSSTELRAQLPATSAGTYVIYVVATDGSVAIRVNGITFSATPTWTTGSTLPEGIVNTAISIQLAATSNSNITYSLASGSTLPSGLSLSSGGVLSGTVTGITVPTTYNFTVNAIDAELQDSPRAFSISISVVVRIARSLRFNNADNAYLNRTPSSAGNRKTWTWSGWVKLTGPATPANAVIPLFGATNAANDSGFFVIGVLDSGISIQTWNTVFRRTTTVYRDYSAWYHIVVAFDTTQATAANRLKLYVNGLEQTAFSLSADPTQNTDYPINNNIAHSIFTDGFGNYLSGYLTEVNFVDGQALTPTSFGEADPDTGVWRPKYYTGTYGTNGYYLNFSDNSNTTAATLGKDSSGNNNNFTPYNFSVTAGVGNDSVVDSPTSYGTDTGVGGEVRGNYATWNPLAFHLSPGGGNAGISTFSNGNLEATNNATGWSDVFSTIAVSSGKFYAEFSTTSAGDRGVGIFNVGNYSVSSLTDLFFGGGGNTAAAGGYAYYSNGTKQNGSSNLSYGASWGDGDIIGVALDMDAGTLVFYKNGVSQGTAYTGLSGMFAFVLTTYYNNANKIANFGQRPFAYTAPSGFKALCSQNLPTPAIGATSTTQAGKYFNVVQFIGNSGTNTVTGVGFQPDLIWSKSRNRGSWHTLWDPVRGRGTLSTNVSNTEMTPPPSNYELISYNNDGFTLGPNYNVSANDSDSNFVVWNWKAGNSTVTNTAGSITSQVRANTTAGFSIVSYSAGATNSTVGHGLGAAPAFIIAKTRDNTNPWAIYHKSSGREYPFGFDASPQNYLANYWGTSNDIPNSTIFGLSYNGYGNNTGNMIAYCWAEIEGYSRFGSYIGNNDANGPFAYCGFRPRWIMIKWSSSGATGPGAGWHIFDTARNTYNAAGNDLMANEAYSEEAIGTTNYYFDILSNGFKVRNNNNGYTNSSGQTYIFAAFAETPFKYARAR